MPNKLRDRLVEAAVWGVSAGGTGAAAGWLIQSGLKASDVLAFLGSLAGAAVTVAGAVWLADRNFHRERVLEADILFKEVDHLSKATQRAFDACVKRNDDPRSFRPALLNLRGMSSGVHGTLVQGSEWAKTLNFRQRARISELIATLETFNNYWDEINAEYFEPDPYDERDISVVVGNLNYAAGDAVAELAH